MKLKHVLAEGLSFLISLAVLRLVTVRAYFESHGIAVFKDLSVHETEGRRLKRNRVP